jgi:hypothetical protein
MEDARQFPSSNEATRLPDYGPEDFLELAQRRRLKATKVGRFWRYCLGDVRIYEIQQEQTDSLTIHPYGRPVEAR